MLIINDIKNKFSFEKKLHSFSLNEFVDENLSTNDNTHSSKGRSSIKAYVESISSNSLIDNVEFMNEDIYDKKNVILLKAKISSKDHSERMRSKVDEIRKKTISPNTYFERQSSNEFIEGIRSVGLQSLKQNYFRAFHSF